MAKKKNHWLDFFDGELGSNKMEVFFGEGHLIAEMLVHPGADCKTMYLDFTQDYAHEATETGICVGIEEAHDIISMLKGFIESRGVPCVSCKKLMHNAYVSDSRGELCYECAENNDQ